MDNSFFYTEQNGINVYLFFEVDEVMKEKGNDKGKKSRGDYLHSQIIELKKRRKGNGLLLSIRRCFDSIFMNKKKGKKRRKKFVCFY